MPDSGETVCTCRKCECEWMTAHGAYVRENRHVVAVWVSVSMLWCRLWSLDLVNLVCQVCVCMCACAYVCLCVCLWLWSRPLAQSQWTSEPLSWHCVCQRNIVIWNTGSWLDMYTQVQSPGTHTRHMLGSVCCIYNSLEIVTMFYLWNTNPEKVWAMYEM